MKRVAFDLNAVVSCAVPRTFPIDIQSRSTYIPIDPQTVVRTEHPYLLPLMCNRVQRIPFDPRAVGLIRLYTRLSCTDRTGSKRSLPAIRWVAPPEHDNPPPCHPFNGSRRRSQLATPSAIKNGSWTTRTAADPVAPQRWPSPPAACVAETLDGTSCLDRATQDAIALRAVSPPLVGRRDRINTHLLPQPLRVHGWTCQLTKSSFFGQCLQVRFHRYPCQRTS